MAATVERQAVVTAIDGDLEYLRHAFSKASDMYETRLCDDSDCVWELKLVIDEVLDVIGDPFTLTADQIIDKSLHFGDSLDDIASEYIGRQSFINALAQQLEEAAELLA